MFPKDYCDMQMMLTKYNLPIWSTLKIRGTSSSLEGEILLMIGKERYKPAAVFKIDPVEVKEYGCWNSTYRQLKAYLDTHYTPVKLPRWPM
jgi:hypothetical protein